MVLSTKPLYKAFLHKRFSVLHSIFLPYKELIGILRDVKYLEYFLTSAECYFCTGIIIMKYFPYLFRYMLNIAGFEFQKLNHSKSPFEDISATTKT